MSDELVTLGDAARQLGIVYQNAYRAWLRGRIPYQRAGSAILVRVPDVENAMQSFKPRPIATPKQ